MSHLAIEIGTLQLESGAHFKGRLENGLASGLGVISWPDGSYYAGDFYKGWFHGLGVFVLRHHPCPISSSSKSELAQDDTVEDAADDIGNSCNEDDNGPDNEPRPSATIYEGEFHAGKPWGFGG